MKHIAYSRLLLNVLILFTFTVSCLANESAYRILSFVDGVKQPVMSLNGAWQFRFAPSGKWETVGVPGELAMQGYAIEHNKPYTYLKTITLPADYADKRIILRFDGVYSYARLSINGKFVREHRGGFTRWETDVTDFVKAGKKNNIQLEITDRLDDISYASGYAHHPVGGILRDVTLFALPQTHLLDFHVETLPDSLYQNFRLKIGYSAMNGDKETKIVYSLYNDAGVKATHSTVLKQDGDYTDIFDIQNPLKWDAEHPNLYTLKVSLLQNNKTIGQFSCQVGFREVKIAGNQMLVNGKPVKLRGACRHDMSPVLGRASTADMDSLDALLYKEANMNFVRTSHYPPTEKFLEYCDRYGIYVECENAICFVGTYRQKNYAPGNSQNDSAYAGQYLSQCHEMVKSFRSHPSILFWSLGNESDYGDNFQQCHDWVKAIDATRPVIFSYPGSEPEKNKIYDILSMHYPYIDGNMEQYGITTVRFQKQGIPALFDEWAHVPCYVYQTLQTDPGIREFWGMSLDKMWSNLFESPGGLGGAIWGYVDETFMLPPPKVGDPWWKAFAHTAKPENFQGNCIGYGEWGIVDVWRRKKPEFWSVKKAYSPVRLLQEDIQDFTTGKRIILPVYNRFDHTRLDEIKAYVVYKGARKEIKLPALEPRRKGLLEIAGDQWENGEKLRLEFLTNDNHLIDAYNVTLGQEKPELPKPVYQGKLNIEETNTQIIIKGNGFEIPFCKETGLIYNAKSGDQTGIEKGPFLNMDVNAKQYLPSDSDWKKTNFTYQQKAGHVLVNIAGTYNIIQVDIQVDISSDGKIVFDYTTTGEPDGYLRESGLKFYLSDSFEHLQWKRKGYWSCYPENDFAGNEGEVSFYSDQQAAYGKKPVQDWQLDTHNYYYWADDGAGSSKPLTQAAKGMKENIYSYTLLTKDKHGFSVLSPDVSVACRTNRSNNEQLVLYANNRWDYPEIAWGNYSKNIENTPCYGKITLILL